MATPTHPQLDLFEHSRDTMLVNDALDALLQRDLQAAAAARLALCEFEPGHHALPALATLIEALADSATGTPFASHAQAAAAREGLEHRVAPAACAQFGDDAAARWLAPCWRRLAERAAPVVFRATHADDHAAALWLRAARSGDAADAEAAARAVHGIESWWRIPAPLAWMVIARHRSAGLDVIWPLLAELAWLAAPRLAPTAAELADPLLNRLIRRFEHDFDPGLHDAADEAPALHAWFPAWLLVDKPALLPRLREARSGLDGAPERAFRLLAELLGLERQGRHDAVIVTRQRLRALQPALYAAYMRTR